MILRDRSIARRTGPRILANMADRFYANCPLAIGQFVLTGAEAHHLAAVMRIRPGAQVCVFNGDGAEYRAVVNEIHKREVVLDITSRDNSETELAFRLEVAAPLPKGDRAEFLIEKLTELGATRFTPLETERSVVHPRDTRLDKLRRLVIESCKQCRRNVLMEISSLARFGAYCQSMELPIRRIIAHPGSDRPSPTTQCDVVIAVGPEGGFTEAEIELARSNGWQVVGLGPRILRIETAAIALAAALAAL